MYQQYRKYVPCKSMPMSNFPTFEAYYEYAMEFLEKTKPKRIDFFSASGEFGFLSNFYKHIDDDGPFDLDNDIYNCHADTVEHFFQAAKFWWMMPPPNVPVRDARGRITGYTYPDHVLKNWWAYLPVEFLETLRADTPDDAKKVARKYEKKVNGNWHKLIYGKFTLKEKIMYELVKDKFTQIPMLRYLLVATGDAILVESSPYDKFWGIGPNRNGENMLGRILMKVRRELASQ